MRWTHPCDDKYAGHTVLDGSVVRLSEQGAELRSSAPVPLLSNLKIWIPEVEVSAGPSELYAKLSPRLAPLSA